MEKKLIVSFLILLFSFLIFSHIETLTIRLWDEARNATNVTEMLKNGLSLVTTYNFNPEHWNTKPPLLIWLQYISISLFGFNELAFRLPTALACLSFVPLFLHFFKRLKFGLLEASVCLIVFITIPMTLKVHTFKTGDYDGLLTLFMTSYLMFFYLYLKEKNKKDIIGFTLCFIGAVMTKGIAGFLFLPALLILTISEGKFLEIIKAKEVYISIAAILTVIFSYYFGREVLDPGYLTAVYENELGGRFNSAVENHIGKWSFYIEFFYKEGLGKYRKLMLVFPFIGLFSAKYRQLTMLCIIVFITHNIIISTAQTKLYWYSLPQIPFMAIAFGLGLLAIVDFLLKGKEIKWKWLILIPVLVYFIGRQVFNVIRVSDYSYEMQMFAMSKYIRENMDNDKALDKLIPLHKWNSDHTRFYVEKNNRNGGNMQIGVYDKLDPGDRAMVIHDEIREAIIDLYELELEGSFGPNYKGKIYKVLKRK